MDLLLVTLKSLGVMMSISFGMLVVMVVGMIVWIRVAVKGKIYAYFLESNRQISTKLIPLKGETKFRYGKDTEYLVDPQKAFWSKWPPGFPDLVKETVPSLVYSRADPEPWDPLTSTPAITPRQLKYLTDESMLKQAWKDARTSTGEASVAGLGISTYLLIAVLGGLSLLGYFTYQVLDKVDLLVQMVGG